MNKTNISCKNKSLSLIYAGLEKILVKSDLRQSNNYASLVFVMEHFSVKIFQMGGFSQLKCLVVGSFPFVFVL